MYLLRFLILISRHFLNIPIALIHPELMHICIYGKHNAQAVVKDPEIPFPFLEQRKFDKRLLLKRL